MVILTDDIENLPPAERVKKLRELKERKEEEKKRLLDEKERELQDASSKLEESIRELVSEDEEHALRQEEHPPAGESLEASVGEEPEHKDVKNISYTALEGLMPANLYELSDYNLYNELKHIEEKGYMTPAEQRRVAELSTQAASITQSYAASDVHSHDQQSGFYLSRTESVLKDLNKQMHDLNDGLYTTRRSG